MPATHVLATDDVELLACWQRQIAPGRASLTLEDAPLPAALPPGVPLVVVLDATVVDRIPPALEKFPTIFVGEPRTQPYEQAKLAGRARHYLSYAESRERLGQWLPLVEELAERNAALELLMEKSRRHDPPRPVARTTGWADTPEIWDFLEGAVENLASRERLLGEFRRASRYLLRASHTVFFLREASGFRADRGSSFCPLEDPLVNYLSAHPVVLDGLDWPGPHDPVAELAVRHRLALWGARLLVPLHENGHLLGMIACGVRDDGQIYDESDKARAVFVARLLRQFLAQGTQLGRMAQQAERTRLGEKYLPHALILAPSEEPVRSVPVAVRALIGEARRVGDTRRIMPSEGQPFRASAGIIAETNGAWAIWEEASSEVYDRAQRERLDRVQLLREVALTLNHEIGNALVSLSALKHARDASEAAAAANGGGNGNDRTAGLWKAVTGDLQRLERLNQHLSRMAALAEVEPQRIDLKGLLQRLGDRQKIRVEVGPEPVVLHAVEALVDFALEAIVSTVAANRPAAATDDLVLQLRSTGEGAQLTALLSLQGKGLELEGILPEPTPEAVPNLGRMDVFIAKEVIRLHRGEVHAGPGLEGTEILVSLRAW